MSPFRILAIFIRSLFKERYGLAAENLALRQQLAVQRRSRGKRPKLRASDRVFWVCLSKCWSEWRSALLIVKPETVVGWHRKGFKLYWARKSRRGRGPGRLSIEIEARNLIRRMSRENPTWGVPRIHAELALLGYEMSRSTIWKYIDRSGKPTSDTWRSFLRNHVTETVGIDFFTVPTATFRVLFCFVILEHSRRRIVHFNVTENPTAEWTSLQVRQAFPFETAPRYMLHDNDRIYAGERFRRTAESMGVREIATSPHSPWQNPYAERVIGSVRRECLDHMIVLGTGHLRRVMREYIRYYNESRCHRSLDGNAPVPREVEPPAKGRVIAFPVLGGLHHRYARAA